MKRTACGLAVLLLLAGLSILTGEVRSQPARAAGPLSLGIDQLVENNGIQPDEPGVAIFLRGPNIQFKKGYGLATVKDRTPITPSTLFELASFTKPFTAMAILQLHERGKLSLQDDVRKHLPELPEYAKNKPIRIYDLLTHTSGLPDYMSFENVPARHKDWWVNEDYVGEFARQRKEFPLVFPTGSKYEYNNSNYLLLGLIIERVSGKSFGKFMHDEIFVPAGMKSSFVYESPTAALQRPAKESLTAIGYEWAKKAKIWQEGWGAPPQRQEKLLTVGDGGIWSNLDDLAQWDLALRGGKLIKPATLRQALTPSKTSDGKTNAYGLGWSVYLDDVGKMNGYGHDGAWNGFRTSYYYLVDGDRTTIVLSNRGNFDPDKFWYALDQVIQKHSPKQ